MQAMVSECLVLPTLIYQHSSSPSPTRACFSCKQKPNYNDDLFKSQQEVYSYCLVLFWRRMGKKKERMGVMETPSIRIFNILLQRERERLENSESVVEVDCHVMEFGDVRYHIQSSIADPQYVELSISLPSWPQESICSGGHPFGAIEAVKGAYGSVIEIIDPPEEGFQLTLALDLAKFPLDKERRLQLMKKIASLRAVVLGAHMREILKNLAPRIVYPDCDQVITLLQHPKESFFLIPLMEKMMVVLPVHFKDSSDAVLAISFLQDFVEARHCAGLKKAPSCIWSPTPPLEMKGAPAYTSSANAGFLSFVIFRHHVEGDKLDRTVWTLSSFHAYLNYHIKRSKGLMHMLMRQRVDNLIQALDRAKVHVEKDKKKLETPGLSCLPKLLQCRKGKMTSKGYGYSKRHGTRASVPIQIRRAKRQRKRIWWRWLKMPNISSLRKCKT